MVFIIPSGRNATIDLSEIMRKRIYDGQMLSPGCGPSMALAAEVERFVWPW